MEKTLQNKIINSILFIQERKNVLKARSPMCKTSLLMELARLARDRRWPHAEVRRIAAGADVLLLRDACANQQQSA